MPDRVLRSSAGVLGGLFIILGATYVWLGLTWIITPTPTRLAGIEWAGLAGHIVGAWWILGGLVSTIGGALSRNARYAGIGSAAAILTPLLVAALFAWSVGQGNTRGYITAGSYAPYAAIAAWVTVRSGRIHSAALRDAARRTRKGAADDGAE